MRTICCLFVALNITLSAYAAEAPKQPVPAPKTTVPPPPPIPPRNTPPGDAPETGLEPEITITTRGDTRYEEYRLNGQLYMIKVTPKTGKPYYLVDEEGAGQFRRSDFEPRISIPRWTIKSW